jgi:hypothetical protein
VPPHWPYAGTRAAVEVLVTELVVFVVLVERVDLVELVVLTLDVLDGLAVVVLVLEALDVVVVEDPVAVLQLFVRIQL